MEKRVDEKILDFINAIEKSKAKKDIKKRPIKIGNRYYKFEEKGFFDEKLKIFIPNDFEDMPKEVMETKYSSETRPDIVKCNENNDIFVTLKIIDSPLDEKQVKDLKDRMKESVKNTNPINAFYDDGVLEVASKNIGFFEFKSYTIDEPLCNLMFFLEFEGKILMGTFCCLYEEYGEWRECIFEVIKNIRVRREDKGDEN